jgi:subtilisin family serine protease
MLLTVRRLLVSSFAVVLVGSATAHADADQKFRKSTILYKEKASSTLQQKEALTQTLLDLGVRVEKKVAHGNVKLAKIYAGLSEEDAVEALRQTGAVDFAETDRLIFPDFVPNDPKLGLQWHLPVINTFAAWDVTLGKRTITIASCDTGVDANHRDLKRNLLPGYNAEDRATTNVAPIHPHGTWTTGTMAAVTNNGIGVSGVAGVIRVLPIRISNRDDGAAFLSAMAHCIEYSADHGARVVNLSYGGAESPTLDVAAKYLRSKKGILVMSAGNEGLDKSANPDWTSFLIVGATDASNARASFSNYGLPTDLVAPGVSILTTNMGGGYVNVSGTSFSAPLVSGAVALMVSINPQLTPMQIVQTVSSTSTPIGSQLEYGYGMVNVGAAVKAARQLR